VLFCGLPDALAPTFSSRSITYLSRFSTYATKVHWDALIRVLRYLKTTIETPFVLKLNNISSKEEATVVIIADSDWANDRADRKSYSGSCVIIDGALVNFITAKQPTVSTSSTEAEYISGSDACKEGLYFRNLLDELIPVVLPIKAWMDNIGAGCIAQNIVNNNRTKHIDVKYHMIRDWISKGIFELFYIESSKNLADIFTKALPVPAHRGLAHRLLSGHSLP
jgi:hypothetical protein